MPATFTRHPVETERKDPGFGGKPPLDRRPTGGGGGDENWDSRNSRRHGPREQLIRYRMAVLSGLAGDFVFFAVLVSAFFVRQSSVHIDATDNVKMSADFAIWDDGFKQTGPLEFSYFVNGRLLDKVKYATPGYKHFEKAVPAGWLAADAESTISVDVDKLYVSPQDGKKFGFILTRIGFLR